MNLFDKRAARVLLTMLAFAVVLGFFWLARKTLIIFLFAMLFAHLLEPVICRVESWTKRSRGLSIGVVYLAIAILLGAVAFVAGPRISGEGQRLSQSLPQLYQNVTSGDIAWRVGQQRGWSFETQSRIKEFLATHRDTVLSMANSFASRAATFATQVGWIFLVPILAVFILKDKQLFGQSLRSTVDDRHGRSVLRNIMSDMDEMLAHYVRAQLTLALISWVVYTIALTALRVPFSFALGAVGGLLEFVPVVGPAVAAVAILGISFTMNYPHMLLVFLFLAVWRVLLDYVISPRVLGGKVELHPLMAIFGILVGGEIAGVVGVYLAIPVMATIRILWKHWQTYGEDGEESSLQKSTDLVA